MIFKEKSHIFVTSNSIQRCSMPQSKYNYISTGDYRGGESSKSVPALVIC